MLFSSLPKNITQFLIILGLAAITLAGFHFANKTETENITMHFNKLDSLQNKIYSDTSKVRVLDYILKSKLDSLSDVEMIRLSEEKLGLTIALIKYRAQIASEERMDKFLKEKNKIIDFVYFLSFWFGMALFVIGMKDFQNQSDEDSQLKQFEILKNRQYTLCNSCGKNFTALRTKGTNYDGSIEHCFCRECYEFGKFTQPDLTVNDMYNEFKKFNPKSFVDIESFLQFIRWNKNPYDEKEIRKYTPYSYKTQIFFDMIFFILFVVTLILKLLDKW